MADPVAPEAGGDSCPSNAPDAEVPFRALFESAPSLCLVLTPDDFTIVAVSEAYLRATMTERAGIMGRKLFEVFPDDPNDPAADGVRNLRKSLERVKSGRRADAMPVQRYPVRRPAEDGGGFEERFWSPINSPVFGGNGELTFIIHRVEDVTPFVRAKQRAGKEEEGWHMLETRAQHMEAEIALRDYDRQRTDELQRALEQLRRSEDEARRAREEAENANRAKDKFLAALSHELRTPLTPVLITASVLTGETRLPGDVREQLAMMQRNIELEARLIDDLLDLTRISRGKLELLLEPVDVHSLLAHTDQIVRNDAEDKGIEIHFALKASEYHVNGDGARLHQVFWNVLKNAIKFTLPGGRVTVKTTNPAPGKLCLTVSDTGVGIDSETLPSVFAAFAKDGSKEAPRSSGLGLGMAISKTIVEMHQGIIRAESAGRGQGSTFTIELAAASPTLKPAVSFREPTDDPGRPYRLLVVEDHRPTLSVLAELLSRQGHQVLTAGTIQEALGLAAGHELDLVISDLGLPDGNGADLMLKLTHDYGLRGIALSGYGMEEDIARTKEVGFIAHLIKPIHFEQLNHAIKLASQAVSEPRPAAQPQVALQT
jgi:signal transduction histidine kinase/ActR/RegA family two-component response regulator